MLDVPFEGKNYQIVVFFRLFLRGDDDYKTLFHQADEHGDFFYNQQNLDNKIADYVACLANPTHKPTAQLCQFASVFMGMPSSLAVWLMLPLFSLTLAMVSALNVSLYSTLFLLMVNSCLGC